MYTTVGGFLSARRRIRAINNIHVSKLIIADKRHFVVLFGFSSFLLLCVKVVYFFVFLYPHGDT